MSGGKFDYDQYKIDTIAETIQSVIEKNGKEKTKDELESWKDAEYLKKYPEDKYHTTHHPEVIEEFKEAVKILKKAKVYAHRIDWLLSGDDGEGTFLKRLREDLIKEGLWE